MPLDVYSIFEYDGEDIISPLNKAFRILSIFCKNAFIFNPIKLKTELNNKFDENNKIIDRYYSNILQNVCSRLKISIETEARGFIRFQHCQGLNDMINKCSGENILWDDLLPHIVLFSDISSVTFYKKHASEKYKQYTDFKYVLHPNDHKFTLFNLADGFSRIKTSDEYVENSLLFADVREFVLNTNKDLYDVIIDIVKIN